MPTCGDSDSGGIRTHAARLCELCHRVTSPLTASLQTLCVLLGGLLGRAAEPNRDACICARIRAEGTYLLHDGPISEGRGSGCRVRIRHLSSVRDHLDGNAL
eukprot:7383337-Prymnesium_polylepis.2